MEDKLIAPCGMNCSVCVRNLAMKNDLNRQGFKKTYCEGCLPRGKHCLHMGDQCEALRKGLVRFCYECKDFPCKRLKVLDKRYRTKYHLSVVDNLNAIKEHGLDEFIKTEEEKWACPDCGDKICCHNGLCLKCKVEILYKNKKYRWGEV